ncbi:MAG: HNH endonuclease [Bacteroidia bacterium]|nr:HNH endonuclease [Bacteroidia bacterium]
MREKVLVLNQDYQAIGVCSVERAFVLVYLRKAEMVEKLSNKVLHSVRSEFAFPSIIRLFSYVRVPFRRVALSRANIFRRDGFQCVYCGSKQHLTLDHVVPRSHAGRDTWENLVTACQSCNTKKGNRTPEQAEMEMNRKPFRPSYIMYLSNFSERVHETWRPYLMQ